MLIKIHNGTYPLQKVVKKLVQQLQIYFIVCYILFSIVPNILQ